MDGEMEDYFRSVFDEKLLVKMPEREDDHLTPATRLLEKRREMAEVEQALSAQKEEFQMKMESLQQRKEELERKEEQLKMSIFKFDKFLKENDSKRTRAIGKAKTEQELTKQKERDLEKLNEQVADLMLQKERLKQRLIKNAVFWKYLEQVAQKSEEFHEIRDVIDRFDTLLATHEALVKKGTENQEAVEKEKALLHQFVKEKSNEILKYNNDLADLQSKVDLTHEETLKWESTWARIQNTAASKTLLLGKIKMATLNLFQMMSKEMRQKMDISLDDTVTQLDKIKLFILDLMAILADLKRADLTSSAGAMSTIN
ncbi:cilia- and flagella-associated protein 73 [Protopterus annectens]|uniref:cilia- and flagella-associated protein 73 n=1 Tax=Protopterus annectens TaxID=7888 RepID=UPI001CFBDF6F|nr:cilia- and flagella-associated protein 73 [Protopterus annectens]